MLDLADVPGIRAVAGAIFEMARSRQWGHVTIRFNEGEIRQVDTLVTVKVDGLALQPTERRVA